MTSSTVVHRHDWPVWGVDVGAVAGGIALAWLIAVSGGPPAAAAGAVATGFLLVPVLTRLVSNRAQWWAAVPGLIVGLIAVGSAARSSGSSWLWLSGMGLSLLVLAGISLGVDAHRRRRAAAA
jgi:hypothetical protein